MDYKDVCREWEQISSIENLRCIYNEHTAKSNSPGVDNITGKQYAEIIEKEIIFINNKLKCRQYKFSKYKISYILKGAKEPRVICIPTQRDKIVAYAITLLLNKLFGGVAKTALPQILVDEIDRHIQDFDYGIKLDIHDFYGSIDHDVLSDKISGELKDEYILKLIKQSININRRVSASGENKGLPQGLSFSNALANIYLAEIDEKYKNINNVCYVRYVDDIILLSNDCDYFETLMDDLKKIGLTLNAEKERTFETKHGFFDFIGYEFQNSIIRIRESSVKKIINTLDRIIRKNRRNIPGMVFKLNIRITGIIWNNKKYGWLFYYSQTKDLRQLFFIDRVLRLKLFPRYHIKKEVVGEVKKLVRVYWEIRKSLHKSKYILNVDNLSTQEKLETIKNILKNGREYTGKEIDELYAQIIRKEITDMEKDVQNLS